MSPPLKDTLRCSMRSSEDITHREGGVTPKRVDFHPWASTQPLLGSAGLDAEEESLRSSVYDLGDLSPTHKKSRGCPTICCWPLNSILETNLGLTNMLTMRRLLSAYLSYVFFGSAVFKVVSIHHWTWAQAVYYAMTTGLSIGYGAMQPSSEKCKLFAIIYVFLGALALSLLLSAFVQKLLLLVPKIAAEEWRHQAKQRASAAMQLVPPPRHWLPVTLWIALLLWTVLGAVWAHDFQGLPEEDQWSWLTCVFFAVGTITTAGILAPKVGADGNVPSDVAAFLAIYAIVGVPLFGVAVSHAISKYIEAQVRMQEREVLENSLSGDQIDAVRELRYGMAAARRSSRHSFSGCERDSNSKQLRISSGAKSPAGDYVTWGDFLALQLLRLKKVDLELLEDLRKLYLDECYDGGLEWGKITSFVAKDRNHCVHNSSTLVSPGGYKAEVPVVAEAKPNYCRQHTC
mmetsp:Transcript_164071/g.290507  ORF Transcript_164071/g.290507 Transcript_164071/m.290507 type:complete len:459 (+) Transcript_164071:65-1441(+)